MSSHKCQRILDLLHAFERELTESIPEVKHHPVAHMALMQVQANVASSGHLIVEAFELVKPFDPYSELTPEEQG